MLKSMEIVNRFSLLPIRTSLRPRISNSSKKILGSVNPIFLRRIGRGVHLTTSEIAYVGNTGRAALCCRDYIIFNFSMRATRLNPTITSNWSRLANILVVIRPCLWPRLVQIEANSPERVPHASLFHVQGSIG